MQDEPPGHEVREAASSCSALAPHPVDNVRATFSMLTPVTMIFNFLRFLSEMLHQVVEAAERGTADHDTVPVKIDQDEAALLQSGMEMRCANARGTFLEMQHALDATPAARARRSRELLHLLNNRLVAVPYEEWGPEIQAAHSVLVVYSYEESSRKQMTVKMRPSTRNGKGSCGPPSTSSSTPQGHQLRLLNRKLWWTPGGPRHSTGSRTGGDSVGVQKNMAEEKQRDELEEEEALLQAARDMEAAAARSWVDWALFDAMNNRHAPGQRIRLDFCATSSGSSPFSRYQGQCHDPHPDGHQPDRGTEWHYAKVGTGRPWGPGLGWTLQARLHECLGKGEPVYGQGGAGEDARNQRKRT